MNGIMTPGELMQFITYSGMLYGYVDQLSNLPRRLMDLVTSMERISDIMNQEPDIQDGEKPVELDIQGEIEFQHASFGYKSYLPVLEDVSLKVAKGEMIGLVGASGTGKSTLINPVMHLYEVDDGAILVDGVDIRDIGLENSIARSVWCYRRISCLPGQSSTISVLQNRMPPMRR